LGFGFAVSSSQRYATAIRAQDNTTASSATRVRTGLTGRCLVVTETGGNTLGADFVS